MSERVRITYRGWQGHCIAQCNWHLNTLLERADVKVVVSTIGQWFPKAGNRRAGMEQIGADRCYETMCFHVDPASDWDDLDVQRELGQFFAGYNDERAAQEGHLAMVDRVVAWLEGDQP